MSDRPDLEREWKAHPELKGKAFRPKGGGIAYSWSVTLLAEAGGYERLMSEWEEVEW